MGIINNSCRAQPAVLEMLKAGGKCKLKQEVVRVNARKGGEYLSMLQTIKYDDVCLQGGM
jgi:hypothetical protein